MRAPPTSSETIRRRKEHHNFFHAQDPVRRCEGENKGNNYDDCLNWIGQDLAANPRHEAARAGEEEVCSTTSEWNRWQELCREGGGEDKREPGVEPR